MQARTVVTALLLTACARGRSEAPAIDGPPASTGTLPIDAPAIRPDMPPASGCTMPFTGTLATWSFTGEPGNQAMTAATTAANGITAGAITRASALTAVAGTTSINASNWPLVAMPDPAKYYALALSPPAGCTLVVTGAMIDARASGTGPASAHVANSTDNYTAATAVSTTAISNVTFTAMASGMIELRVFGFAATGTAGTFRLQNALSITGELK